MIILGAGVKAEHLCDLFNLWDEVTQFYETPRSLDETKRGKPVTDKIIEKSNEITVFSAVGETRPKRDIIHRFIQEAEENNINYRFKRLKHHTCVVVNPERIGVDFTIRDLSSIGTRCRIGKHVSIGPHANISHHSTIEDYVTVAGGVNMSGGVTVGEGAFIGQGASIKPDIRIGRGAVIGTGAAVVRDVPPNMVYAGNPARHSPKFKGVSPW